MSDVALQAELELAAPSAREVVAKTLLAIAERSRSGGVSLSAGVQDAQSHELARLAVPVVVQTNAGKAGAGETPSLHIAARSTEAAFPAFEGTVSVEPLDAARSRVLLLGSYRVPLGPLGAVVNALALDSVARNGLQGFLDLLVRESVDAVRQESNQAYRDLRRG